MAWQHLERFIPVLDDEDFTYFANKKRIITLTHSLFLALRDENTEEVQSSMATYQSHVQAFSNRYTFSSLVLLDEGLKKIDALLLSFISILQEPLEKREKIGRALTRRVKIFLGTLNTILIGIRASFLDSALAKNMGWEPQQIGRYILDKNEGMGKKYKFNTLGRYSPVKKLTDKKLSSRNALEALKLFLSPGKHAKAVNNDLFYYGSGRHRARAHFVKTKGKIKIYSLFFTDKSDDHNDHMNELGQKTLPLFSPA